MKVQKIKVYPTDSLYFIAYQIFLTGYFRIIISPDGLSWFEDYKTRNYSYQFALGKKPFFNGKQKVIVTYSEKEFDNILHKEQLTLLKDVINDLIENEIKSVEEYVFYSEFWKKFEQEDCSRSDQIITELIKKYQLKTLKELNR